MLKNIHIFPIKMRMPDEGNPAAAHVPLMAAAIQTRTDLIMIDTGFPGESDLLENLNALHFHPADFTAVINTHVHIDHVGHNHAFVNARILVSRVDFDYARTFSHAFLESSDIIAIMTEFFPHAHSRRIEAGAHYLKRLVETYWRDDILGNPAHIEWIEDAPALPDCLSFLHTPGHTPGHCAVIVRGASTSFIAAGDAMGSRLFWKRRLQELTPRFSTELFLASKQKIESLHGIVMGGHDLPFRTEDLSYIQTKVIKI
ncbi:MBL fold metallo-hydrolase [candidate division KSB1 bacterium]|nr:MBL fold metallo-hydrolase [candidate division KSB1 bacterium]RQW01322.1 MAG: MBL fold metallo-hydrolase [candidate division KSB1 bacterium]